MAIPGLLVEYLVTGAMALIWVMPLFGISVFQGESITLGKGAVLLPAIYVLGMYVDAIAYLASSRVPTRDLSAKRIIRRYVEKQTRESNDSIYASLNPSELLKECQMRDSRDRIARGAVINIALTFILTKDWSLDNTMIFLGLMTFSIMVWIFFEANSYRFEMACKSFAKKLKHPNEN